MASKKERVMDALNELFSDTLVPHTQTRDDLNEVRDEIGEMLDSLEGLG